MPRITAPTVAEHREQRRADLLEAAAALMLRHGQFTVAEVATEVGLSRSAVYEYYSSAADLIADVLVDELADWADALERATADIADPAERVSAWVGAVLHYVAEGRHALVRAAGTIDLPATRRAEVQGRHRDLVRELHVALTDLGCADPTAMSAFIWGSVNAAITRIEAGSTAAEDETAMVLDFIQGGLAGLVLGR